MKMYRYFCEKLRSLISLGILLVDLVAIKDVLVEALASAVRRDLLFDLFLAAELLLVVVSFIVGDILELLELVSSSLFVLIRAAVLLIEAVLASVTHGSCFGEQVLLIG